MSTFLEDKVFSLVLSYRDDLKAKSFNDIPTSNIVYHEANPLNGLNADIQKKILSELELEEIIKFSEFLSKKDFNDVCRLKFEKDAEIEFKKRVSKLISRDKNLRSEFISLLVNWELKYGNRLVALSLILTACVSFVPPVLLYCLISWSYVYNLFWLPTYIAWPLLTFAIFCNFALFFFKGKLLEISNSIYVPLIFMVGGWNLMVTLLIMNYKPIDRLRLNIIASFDTLINKIPAKYKKSMLMPKVIERFHRKE